jgi:hypothetical protein
MEMAPCEKILKAETIRRCVTELAQPAHGIFIILRYTQEVRQGRDVAHLVKIVNDL